MSGPRFSPAGRQLQQQSVVGELHLQQCGACGAVQYPPREVCGQCLADELRWQLVAGGGELLARSELQHSLEPHFAAQLPWTLASVKLDCGPVLLVQLSTDCPADCKRVEVRAINDIEAGHCRLQAVPEQQETT